MTKLIIDPVTRIEGHLRIETEIAGGKVTAAYSSGEMFRGFEQIMSGRDPLDAPIITQRICGVCPVSHAIASTSCLEDALKLQVPANGHLLKNLILGANYLQSHIMHFYQLSALDFLDVEAILAYNGNEPALRELKGWVEGELKSNHILPAAPFLPRISGKYPANHQWNTRLLKHYLEALEIRRESHKMAAIFGGKIPHVASVIPGGVTSGAGVGSIEDFRGRLRTIRRFIENSYLPDVMATAKQFPQYLKAGRGVQNFLSFGVFQEQNSLWLPGGTVTQGKFVPLDIDKISEDIGFSRYTNDSGGHPSNSKTQPEPHKANAYSWIKAPRYDNQSFEVGPLARMTVAYHADVQPVRERLDALLHEVGGKLSDLPSVFGRHATRALEASLVAERMENWLDNLVPGAISVANYTPSQEGRGVGLTEAPRGALGHWIEFKAGKITHYQCLVPSTWNFSPRDSYKRPGPVETAIEGAQVNETDRGLEVVRIVRSFDPCIACAVH